MTRPDMAEYEPERRREIDRRPEGFDLWTPDDPAPPLPVWLAALPAVLVIAAGAAWWWM